MITEIAEEDLEILMEVGPDEAEILAEIRAAAAYGEFVERYVLDADLI